MWWHGPGWGPGYGWWLMPLFGIIFLIIALIVVSRFFGRGGGPWCGGHEARTAADERLEELIREIKALKEEVKELKESGRRGGGQT